MDGWIDRLIDGSIDRSIDGWIRIPVFIHSFLSIDSFIRSPVFIHSFVSSDSFPPPASIHSFIPAVLSLFIHSFIRRTTAGASPPARARARAPSDTRTPTRAVDTRVAAGAVRMTFHDVRRRFCDVPPPSTPGWPPEPFV